MTDGIQLTAHVLAAASAVVGGIQDGMRARGFDDVRPAHGFLFVRVSGDGATVQQIADHLGVSKQAASQMVDELRGKGYLETRAHPDDGRSRMVVLSRRGRACTRAAVASADATVDRWRRTLGDDALVALGDSLAAVATPGRMRPVW